MKFTNSVILIISYFLKYYFLQLRKSLIQINHRAEINFLPFFLNHWFHEYQDLAQKFAHSLLKIFHKQSELVNYYTRWCSPRLPSKIHIRKLVDHHRIISKCTFFLSALGDFFVWCKRNSEHQRNRWQL